MSHPSYLVSLGGAVPAVVYDDNWRGVANMVRWARSVPVQEVRDFMAQLPGKPIPPNGQQIIDSHIITRSDAEHMDVIVPVHLKGSDQIWALSFLLDVDHDAVREEGEDPHWLWGLGPQRLISAEQLRELTPAA